ncbi:MAG: SGNH/GDSL hydrolase family protein [Bacteroidetes bacterium]|jgi:hypothetical protein|nr:SGNH/GDSL hydrolase family protein [Bacteroidota bacterium]
MHIALVGDSTLDNTAYTAGGPGVRAILDDLFGDGVTVSLEAVDGARMCDIPRQIDTLPADTSHIVLSVGGNDALLSVDVLSTSVSTVDEALDAVATVTDRFAEDYRRCLRSVLDLGLPTTVCTIYPGDFSDTGQQRIIEAALTHWNHAIVQAALDHGCGIIYLGRVCDDPSDYVQQIEPNERGGRNIARAIHSAVAAPEEFGVTIGPHGPSESTT